MKEITVTKTVVEVTGYEASDGTRFNTKEECMKYEQSAEAAVSKMFEDICVKPYGDTHFAECEIYENYGYGSEEYLDVIADIKTEKELKIANMYCDMWAGKNGKRLDNKYIGKRVLIAVGIDWDRTFYAVGTEEEMIEGFKKTMAGFFRPEEKGGEK